MTGLKNIIRSMKGNRSLYSSLLLQTVIIMVYISTISTEIIQLQNDGAISADTALLANKNKVTTTDECKKYLCKYGYLKCDCQDNLMRNKRQLMPGGMRPSEDGVTADNPDSVTTPSDSDSITTSAPPSACTGTDFTEGLKTFQKNYRLNITGICDERTTNQMSQRRCGQPDTVIDKLDDELAAEKSVRKTRSLSSIISKNVQLDESVERRKAQLKQYMKEMENEHEAPENPGVHPKERQKRSQISMTSSDYGGLLTKERVTWRLMSDHLSHAINPREQRSILKQAFRYWSEVAPLCFHEDRNSWDRVDIEIGFLEGVHLSCYRQFDGYGGEIAHKFYRDVHFDNSEPYTTETSTTTTRISLLLVAVHELGHVIGLNHSDVADSVMNAIYHQRIHGVFELSAHDRREVKRSYGSCYGTFDTAFDFVRTKKSTKSQRVYSTFFFRNDHYWKYENVNQKTRFGDPLLIDNGKEFKNLPRRIDTFLHVYKYSDVTKAFRDEYLFFHGNKYYQYDVDLDRIVKDDTIASKFTPDRSNSSNRIPSNIDAAYYDFRRQVQKVLFFKGDKVYEYDYDMDTTTHKCCEEITSITSKFPPASPGDLYSPSGNTYARDIDAVYFSNYYRKMYILKGNDVWWNEIYGTTNTLHRMKYLGKWSELWQFICDGECS